MGIWCKCQAPRWDISSGHQMWQLKILDQWWFLLCFHGTIIYKWLIFHCYVCFSEGMSNFITTTIGNISIIPHTYIYIVTVYIYIYIHITIRWLGNSFCLMVFWMDLLHGVPTHTSVTCSMSRLHPAPNPPKMYELDSGTSTICVISSQDLTRTSVHHISFTYIYIYIYISICIYVCIYI